MSTCKNCGGPLTIGTVPIDCPFCEIQNEPAPKEVQVAVPVQVVHNVIQVAGDSAAAELRCPHCKKRLVTVRVSEINLSGCGACGGIWVDNASATQVLAKPMPVFADLARRCAHGATGGRGRSERPTCPSCPAVLDRSRVHGIELDVCTDHGTWFDANELSTLVHALRNEPDDVAKNVANDKDDIACPGCGTKIWSKRANITPDGLRCEACWRGQQSDAIAAATAQHNTTSGIAVAGVLFGVAAVMLGASKSA